MATVVSAYYPLNKAKRGVNQYMTWIKNFCSIPCNLVFYTDASTAPLIRKLRGDLPTVVIERDFHSFRMTSPHMMKLWGRHHALDREKSIHSPELYAVWALKQEFVRDAITQNHYKSTYFIWCDCGIYRDPSLYNHYKQFPSLDVCNRMCSPGRIVFLEVEHIPDAFCDRRNQGLPIQYPTPFNSLGGGCIAGDVEAWADFGPAYEKMVLTLDTMGIFVGKDQNVFFTMLMLNATKSPFLVYKAAPFALGKGDYWFSLPIALGGAQTLEKDGRF